MKKEITLQGNVTTSALYARTLSLLWEYYKHEKEAAPTIDLTKVAYIEPRAIPLLIAFGEYFSRLYDSPIELRMEERSPLQNFLINIGFHRYAREQNFYDISYDYYKNEWLYANRDVHKIIWMRPAKEYSDVAGIEEPELRRAYLFDNIQKNIEARCEIILADTHKLPEYLIRCTIEGLAEILTNASFYSTSHGYAYLASDRFGTKGGVCDCGIGLKESFENQGYQCGWAFENGDVIQKAELRNYYLIMEIMNYSYCKHKKGERCNLWTVQNDLTRYGGTFKIHYGNTQVIFNARRCGKCRTISYFDGHGKRVCAADDLKPCLKCIQDEYFKNRGAIMNYGVAFRGVHVEFEIPRR